MNINVGSNLSPRVSNLENIILKVAYYAEITELSGQIIPPSGSTILLDQWANGVDAVLSEIEGGKPTFNDTGLDVSFDSIGNYTVIGGSLPSSPIALIYYLSISLKNYSNLDIQYIIEQVSLIAGITIESTPIQLKAISKIDQVIPTYPSYLIPIPEVIQETNGIVVDSNGHITFQSEGFYRIQVQLNIANSNNTSIDTWAEYYNGSSWEQLPESGNVFTTGNSSESNFLIETTLTITNPLQIRLLVSVQSGSGSLNYTIADGIVGVPSCTYLAYKLNPTIQGLAVQTNDLSSNFIIGSQASNNYTFFETDGTLKAIGTALTWDEVSQPLFGANLFITAGRIDYNYADLTIDYSDTARYPNEYTGVVIQMPHRRALNTEIRPHLHWMMTNNNQPNILIEYRTGNNGGVFSSWVLKALTVSDNLFPYLLNGQQITEFNLPTSVGENMPISGTFECRIYRDVNNNSGLFAGVDNYTGTLSLKYYDIHFLVDMFGSQEEFVKY